MHLIGLAVLILLVSLMAVHADALDDLDAAITQGQFATAGEMVDSAGPQAPAWLADYLLGYALLAEGRAAEAEAAIRPWVARAPGEMRPRHLLITTQLAQQDYRAAVYNIRRNLALTTDPQARQQYNELLAQYEEVNPSSGFGLTFGAAPSTNVTRGTAQSTVLINGLPFTVTDSGREQSGATVTLGFTGFRKFAVGERTDLVASGALTLETGFEDTQQDVLSFAPSLQLQHSFERTLISVGPVAEIQWVDGDRYVDRYGFSLAISHQLSQRTSGALRLRATRQDYETADFLDGYRGNLDVSVRHALTPQLTATFGLGLERELTDAPHLTYSGGSISAGLERTWQNGIFTDFSVSYIRRDYNADFPAATFPRQDDRYEVQIGAAYEAFTVFGAVPYVGLRHIRNKSNISLYDYTSNDLVLSARKRF